jgi:hypothetical protein
MMEFMDDDTFKIIVIVFFVFIIGILIWTRKNSSNDERITKFMDDIDYRLDRINTKINDLMNTLMNGVIGYSDDNKNEEKEQEEESDSESDIVYEKSRDYNNDETNSESNLKPSSSGNSLEEKILGTVSEHLNYEGIMFSDIPETTVLEGDTTSVEENETQKLNVVKRTLNTEN